VAGRSAYELVLRPRDPASLVSSVRIAIDGATHIPLRVQVYGSNTGKPAVEVGFTSFDPTSPDATVFRFNPPPGTKVTQESTTHMPSGAAKTHGQRRSSAGQPTIVGSGWTTVAVAKLPAASGSNASMFGATTKQLPAVSGAWGSGHVLRGTLFSAVLTNDGRVAIGAVAPNRLYAALARR